MSRAQAEHHCPLFKLDTELTRAAVDRPPPEVVRVDMGALVMWVPVQSPPPRCLGVLNKRLGAF